MKITRRMLIAGVLIVLVLLAGAWLVRLTTRGANAEEVIVLTGGSMKAVMGDVIRRYATVSHDRIMVSYGESADFAAQLAHGSKGDIFMCHDPFMSWAEEKGLISEWKTVAYLDNVIVVPKGNPRNIRQFSDLAKPGIRLGVGDRRYSTSGVVFNEMLAKSSLGTAIASNIVVESKGHAVRCESVAQGHLDAAIVWNAVAHLMQDRVDIVGVDRTTVDAMTSATYKTTDLRNIKVTAGLVRQAASHASARRFYKYLTESCGDLFGAQGFRTEGVISP
jgi:molybdate transport system substrate-binding protein